MSARADDYWFKKKIDAGEFQSQLKAAGITCDYVVCSEDNCRIANVSADPAAVISAYVYVDPLIAIRNNRLRAIVLVKKLRADTITVDEQKELLGRLALILLSQ